MQKKPLHGLYAITDQHLIGDRLLQATEQALQGGVSILQYRDKTSDIATRRQQAHDLKKLCVQYGATFIINDDVALANEVNADGVHIGKDDTNIQHARQVLGAEKIIGVSCYNQLPLAIEAEKLGADYIAFGRFFASQTKPQAVPASLELLISGKQQLGIPVCCIGGINASNAAQLVQQGADMLAVIQAVFGQQDIKNAARQIAALFTQPA